MNVRHFWTKFFGMLSNLLVFGLFCWILFILGKSVWQNYQTSQKIKGLQQQISDLQEEKARLENLIVYEKTDAFREIEARKRLGLKRPGEKVMIVVGAITTQENQNLIYEPKTKAIQDETPNYVHWWRYIFGP